MTSKLTLHAAPAAGFDQPFEMLAACHQRVARMLGLLERLAVHLAAQGCDDSARQAAQDVMRYFDLAGPAHHEDEERHIFPPLLARGGPALHALVQQLQQDHRAMAQQWQAVRADLLNVAAGSGGGTDPARWAAFVSRYRSHIEAEESQAYPAAQPLLDAATLVEMGCEMAQRRGARQATG